jgi:hypothetical protein
MPGYSVIMQIGFGGGFMAAFEHHATILRILVLLMIFLTGCFEGFLEPRHRDLACATWFLGLGALTAWIVYPLTTVRICLGVGAFVLGLVLMIVYYQSRVPKG